jgi:hypothetical protein
MTRTFAMGQTQRLFGCNLFGGFLHEPAQTFGLKRRQRQVAVIAGKSRNGFRTGEYGREPERAASLAGVKNLGVFRGGFREDIRAWWNVVK